MGIAARPGIDPFKSHARRRLTHNTYRRAIGIPCESSVAAPRTGVQHPLSSQPNVRCSRVQTFALSVAVVLVTLGCAARPTASPAGAPAGRNFVIWISVDALRHDYVARYRPPFLSRLAREGAFTEQLIPIFPSL